MKKLIDVFYQISGVILVLTFFLTLVTGFLLMRFNFAGHSFNVPVFFASIFLLSLFVIFTIKPSWKQKSGSVMGWKKYAASFFILALAVVAVYFGVYLPLNSRLLVEIPNKYLIQSEPFIIEARKDTKYYVETDVVYTQKGTEVTISASSEEWFDEVTFTVGKKKYTDSDSGLMVGTTIADLPFGFPENGIYKLSITFENSSSTIRNVRLFERL